MSRRLKFLAGVFGGVLFLAALAVSVILSRRGAENVTAPPLDVNDPPSVLEKAASDSSWQAIAPSEAVEIPPQNRAMPANVSPVVSCEISSPSDGESVPRVFPLNGTCGPVPPGQQLWLVVQTGSVYSPKVAVQIDGQYWTGSVREFGVGRGGNFEVCLFQVSDEGAALIAEWAARGKATGSWPPFREVPGGIFLAKIKLRLAR